MAIEYPLINGARYSFSSIEVQMGRQNFLGFKEISYDEDLEPADVMGAFAQKLGGTRGELKSMASLTLFAAEWDAFKATMLPGSKQGFGEVFFDIVVNYRETGQTVVTDKLQRVRIKKVSRSHSGTDALEVKLDLWLGLPILWNGKTMLTKTRGVI